MEAVRRLVDFYRVQFELIWHWRRGRGELLRWVVVSFVVAYVALGVTAYLLPGLAFPGPLELALAVVVIAALSALVRPVFLALIAPHSLVLTVLASLTFQVVVILALVPLVPGAQVRGVVDAFIASWVFAIINSLLTWLLSIDRDDSYYGALVRRLVARRPDVVRTHEPGLVIVQIDGLSHPVLAHQIRAGQVPVMSRWVRSGRMRLGRWITLLPTQTSASQAGIMHGRNDGIPAFRWWDKARQRLVVSNRAADATEIADRVSDGRGLLSRGGASVGNLFSGDAERAYLTLATLNDPSQGLGQSRAFFSFFVSPYSYLHSVVLALAEVGKELFQARRQRLAGVEPRLDRAFPYPVLRALTNVVLRRLITSLVVEEMLRGTPVIYADYTDYDEIAHHSGPERPESLDALDGIDRALATLEHAAEDAPRPYRFLVLSDHGQSLGATFRQRYGQPLEDLVRELMGGAASVVEAVSRVEQWSAVNAFLSEVSRTSGATGVMTRTALRGRRRDHAVPIGPPPATVGQAGGGAPSRAAGASDREAIPAVAPPELVVCASGNLALVYFPRLPGRVTLEQLSAQYPGMVDALANHPGIGLLMVRSKSGEALVVGRDGVHHVATGQVDGADPLAPYGQHALDGLRHLDAMAACGDLVLVSLVDGETGEVAAFEELIGSHGGVGGPQSEAVLLYPSDWSLEADPLVGAPALYRQIGAWLAPTGIELGGPRDTMPEVADGRAPTDSRDMPAEVPVPVGVDVLGTPQPAE